MVPTQETKEAKNDAKTNVNYFESYNVFSAIVACVAVAVILFIAFDECRTCFAKSKERKNVCGGDNPPKYWVYGKNVEAGYLSNVFSILDRFGYKNDPNASDWDLLWAHDYPFRTLFEKLDALKPHQKVNHFPGCGYITNKVDLATSDLKYIPPAFKLPADADKLVSFAERNPTAQFVQKNNDHRNIRIKSIADLNLSDEGSFVQEFVDKPLLISGYKFDIGIYTVITSVDPLRLYIYIGDALLRFCPIKYHPFDPENLDKYVVGDDYLPTWEVPDLKYYYNNLRLGMKESLNAHLRSKQRNPSVIWSQIEEAIRIVVLNKEPKIVDIVNRFKSKRNFFEMMRFDFVVDENLTVYLMEANMSPNLSSAHFPPNKLLFEQVIFNLFGLVGIGRQTKMYSRHHIEDNMQTADKNIAVFPNDCSSALCKSSCISPVCYLCRNCVTQELRETLFRAHEEHLHRGDCKRIFPPPMNVTSTLPDNLEEYSFENQIMYRWFLGKCLLDSSWC